ncbi:EAL domain-containing protein [Pseudoduganella sp. OTU4001]|uniref:EAL domain-containing protein n=1 Tax=Pseudoduganella sp. OTU4001 TaxID=3043854 RepID=UPI00313A9337
MRISSKLSAILAAVFLTVGGAGAIAVESLEAITHREVLEHATAMAEAMANMAAFGNGPEDYQRTVQYFHAREKRDLEVFAPDLTIIADTHAEDIGTQVEPGPRRAIISSTLRDGTPRRMTEAATADTPEMEQVVVPMRDGQGRIIAALAYEYTPLYEDLTTEAARAEVVVGLLAIFGLLTTLAVAWYVARNVARPLSELSEAALAMSRGARGMQVRRRSNDEIGELAAAFNTMGAALYLRERAIESSSNAIMIANLVQPGYPIEYVNAAFGRITGYDTKEAIGQPVNFLTRAEDRQGGLQSLREALLQGREGHAVLRSYRKDGSQFWNEVYLSPVREADGPPQHFIAIFSDITEARNDAEQLARQAHYDSLTGLANRSLLCDRLNQAIAVAERGAGAITVALLDLDDFKLVNDHLGHEHGDGLLRTIAERLQEGVRGTDTVARLAGDEFVVLLIDPSDPGLLVESHITELMRRLAASVVQPVRLGGQDVRVTCSIGLATYPQDGANADTLLRNADTAAQRAKELGNGHFQFFTAALQDRARSQLELGDSLRRALEKGEFELHYQPQVSLRTGRIVGLEALLRWRDPVKGLVSPGQFINYAEESGLILPIGEWVLREACRQNKAWQDAGLPPLPVAVNVSARQCAQQKLEQLVSDALSSSGLEPRYLELELTESMSMADPQRSVAIMESMKAIGCELSLDDFGTGYSSMSYLKRFPIDRLKLDLSFVRDITTDPGSLAISSAIITMAHSLHLEVVAEGVETEGQLAQLLAHRCDVVQGYYFSRPLGAVAAGELLRASPCLPPALIERSPGTPGLLVLDDDPHILELIELLLSAEGFNVRTTSDPQRAFELLACEEFAAVLCDQRMPAMNGTEFLGRVRRMYPQVYRVMLSGYEDVEAIRQAINVGAVYKFIAKPLEPEELKAVAQSAVTAYQGNVQLKSA